MRRLTPAVVFFALAILSQIALAQESQVSLPPPQPQSGLPHVSVARQFLNDEKAIWTSPLRIRRNQVKWLVPLAAGAAALVATDWDFSQKIGENSSISRASHVVSNLGGGAPMMAASGTMLALGKLTHNDRAVDAGGIALQAVLHTQLVVTGIKMATNRERPDKPRGHGSFFAGGRSFPSGHAATTFALATVLASEYHDKKWVGIGAYGFATAVSLSRLGGRKHFPSDVVIGASMGYLISRYVLKHHHPGG